MKKIIIVAIFSFFTAILSAQVSKEYANEFNSWKKKRIEDLKAPHGWINLVGLYWLQFGINTFGRDTSNDIIFPKDFPLVKGGVFNLHNGIVSIRTPSDQIKLFKNKQETKDTILFNTKYPKDYVESRFSNFSWSIIQRQEKFGVRLRNFELKKLIDFHDIPSFPLDSNWIFPATFVPAEQDDIYGFENKIGQSFQNKAVGSLEFIIHEKKYSLEIMSKSSDGYFIVFGDMTSGEESYPAGRFLSVKNVDANNQTFIDFNKAINPPCAFSDFATCPLPPDKNILPIRIDAGEKNIHL
ncbi:DUF1684 domain-containing protein [Rhizosphaericola mali]|uniref:DUF1684 domain-containing protein n=1 Tax=Rhizosphaericola mali TaxID=2545455 RepID=A0A5P2FZD0_9BACT|nr:DUF1684 domain-containing protein [Rhizosphaericola mali]QES88297.1 DUF1684 domain-containing protein [Rhizosphaericola mali]